MPVYKRIYMDLPSELVDQAKEVARSQGLSFKAWVTNLVVETLTKTQKSSKKKGGR